jgi:hypothetical protein
MGQIEHSRFVSLEVICGNPNNRCIKQWKGKAIWQITLVHWTRHKCYSGMKVGPSLEHLTVSGGGKQWDLVRGNWRTVDGYRCISEVHRTGSYDSLCKEHCETVQFTYLTIRWQNLNLMGVENCVNVYLCIRMYVNKQIRKKKSQWGRDFSHTSRSALGPTQPPVRWVLGISRG